MRPLLSVLALAGVAFPTGRSEGLFLMLRAYFDDSGSGADSEVAVVAGLIGTVQQWSIFEHEWGQRLADPLPGYNKPPLRMFHLSPCNARDGEFREYNDAECNAVTHDFRQIIIRSGLISTSSAIDRRAWDDLVVGKARKWLGNAIDVCIENCVKRAIENASSLPDSDLMAVVFDQGMWTQRRQEFADFDVSRLTHRPQIVSVTYAQVVDVFPLQGADIAATENYWYAIRLMRDGVGAQPRAHMAHYLKNMIAEGFMIDRSRIAEMLPRLLAKADQLEADGDE